MKLLFLLMNHCKVVVRVVYFRLLFRASMHPFVHNIYNLDVTNHCFTHLNTALTKRSHAMKQADFLTGNGSINFAQLATNS